MAETAAETGLSGTNGLFEVAARTYRLRRSQSSMSSQVIIWKAVYHKPIAQNTTRHTPFVCKHCYRIMSSCSSPYQPMLS